MMPSAPARHDLVLVGGGHTHALTLRMLAMDPIPETRLTLVSPDTLTPYSGMLPGLIAGHYQVADTHIDLARLCHWAGARFIAGAVTRIDLERNRLLLADQQELDFDWLSLDVGSTPEIDHVPGAREHALPVKPVASLRHRWHQWLDSLPPGSTPRVVVVGGGAGGVEMALAVAHSLQRRGIAPDMTLVSGSGLLPGYPRAVQRRMARHLAEAGIALVQDKVQSVTANQVLLTDSALDHDQVLWCTGATGHDFLLQSSLATTDHGFVEVRADLRSTSHRNVFAAGDCAHFLPQPLPKAGVYAVRQAPFLAHNLRAAISGLSLRPYRPQKGFLSLLSAGSRQAVGNRGPLTVAGDWVWQWKDRIDRRFMARFAELPPRQMPAPPASDPRCAGCGAKIGNTALQRALLHLNPVRHSDIVTGLDEREDASSIQWPAGRLLVQSHDYFPAFINEPMLFGRISVIHALSDLYAVNARAHSALATVCLPVNHQVLQSRDLKRLMSGAVDELNRADCALVGGHTIEGPQLAAGFTVNGAVEKSLMFRKGLARPGDRLILTKPLGTGILLAAHMQSRCPGPWLDNMFEQMLVHNERAANVFAHHGVRACTDITGFGLLGHLLELCDAGHVGAELDSQQIPTLDGAMTLAGDGVHSTLKPGNDAALSACSLPAALTSHPLLGVLTDPQTSGGLLAAVPSESAASCLATLRSNFIPAAEVGIILDRDGQHTITIR